MATKKVRKKINKKVIIAIALIVAAAVIIGFSSFAGTPKRLKVVFYNDKNRNQIFDDEGQNHNPLPIFADSPVQVQLKKDGGVVKSFTVPVGEHEGSFGSVQPGTYQLVLNTKNPWNREAYSYTKTIQVTTFDRTVYWALKPR